MGQANDQAVQSAALDMTPLAAPWIGVWDGSYHFPIEGSQGEELILPADREELRQAIVGIYVVAGQEGVAAAWRIAGSRLNGFDEEIRLTEARGDASGPDQDEVFRSWWRSASARNPGIVPSPDPAATRLANSGFLIVLQSVIGELLPLEEAAQRWYEDKLIALIELDLAQQALRIEEAWTRYVIVDGSGVPAVLGQWASATGLSLLGQPDDRAGFEGSFSPNYKPPKPGDTHAGDGQAVEPATFPAVLVKLHEASVAYFNYKQAMRQHRSSWAPKGDKAGASAGLVLWTRMREKLASAGSWDFIIFAAFHKVVQLERDVGFDPRRCEQLVIQALIDGRAAIEPAIAGAKAARLFVNDEPLAQLGDGVGEPASTRAIQDAYAVVGDQGSRIHQPQALSPWLQAPYHARMCAVAAHLSGREPTLRNLGEGPVGHLLSLFQDPEDRMLLDAVTRPGTLCGRARDEMVRAFANRAALDAEARVAITFALMGMGVLAIPMTGGGSLLTAAAVCDALLVAKATSEEITAWIGRANYSQQVVDEIGAEAWNQPASAELIGLLLDAGLTVAGDLVGEGLAGRVFDAIGCVQLLGGMAAELIALVVQDGDGRP